MSQDTIQLPFLSHNTFCVNPSGMQLDHATSFDPKAH